MLHQRVRVERPHSNKNQGNSGESSTHEENSKVSVTDEKPEDNEEHKSDHSTHHDEPLVVENNNAETPIGLEGKTTEEPVASQSAPP
jgi:hypothetical protein